MRTRFAQLSLPTKILLTISCALTLLFAITGAIVWGNIDLRMSSSLKEREGMRCSFQPYEQLWQSRQGLLKSSSRLDGEMREERLALVLVSVSNGKVLAALGGDNSQSPPSSRRPEVVRTAAVNYSAPIGDPHEGARMPNYGFFVQNDTPCEPNQTTVTPVSLDSPHEPNPGKVLMAGHKVDALASSGLNEATGSDFVFDAKDGVMASSLNPRVSKVTFGNLLSARDSNMVRDSVQNHAWFRQPQDISASEVSFEDVEQLIAGHSTTILLLWLAAASGALALTYLLAQRIVERMERPARAAAEASHENYAIEVGVCGEDEMGRLARMPNVKCGSIKQAREGVIHQERITGTGRLSASILHDLWNPVAAISGAAEMLVDKDLPPAQIKRLSGNIYRASQRIQEMLQDQLNVSRGESRRPEPSRLREIAEAACESLSATAESYGTTLAVEIAPVVELPLNRARMERAFVNLISNAIEAMPEGGQVRISAQFVAGSVVVHVDDTGPGVAPEIRSRLFQPFVTAGKSNGVGLGLVFTRQTVLEHGGDLWLDIAPGGGARFSLRLPGAHVVQSQSST
jgi:signal transduction histidine kinase